jgi:DNA-binding transcriptional LysR family regulator
VVPALAAFARRYPAVSLSLAIGNSEQVLAALLAERCDVAVLADLSPDPRLHARVVKRDRVVLVVGRQHRWARRRSLRIGELAGEPMVMREHGSITRKILERALGENGVRVGRALEIGSREAVREAVAAGLGVGAVFESELGHDERLRKLAVSDVALTGTEYVVCLEARRTRPVEAAFIQIIVSAA